MYLLQGCGACGCLLALLLLAALPGALRDEGAVEIVRCRVLPPPGAVLHVPHAHQQPNSQGESTWSSTACLFLRSMQGGVQISIPQCLHSLAHLRPSVLRPLWSQCAAPYQSYVDCPPANDSKYGKVAVIIKCMHI